ncbi:MAG: S-methyl-5'-thioinosine phosphorylase [Xanthomonadales bacterium]|nr:S-methyl-5'-thioinosine phosphorylase [Xanthomonadales bacterium]
MSRLGLIGGTGLDDWGRASCFHTVETPYGPPSARLAAYEIAGCQVFFLPRHGEQHQIPPHAVNYRANIDAFRQLGVEGIIAVNAVGGIAKHCYPGRIVLPDQLIDYSWGRAHSFSMAATDALQHIEFGEPFSAHLRQGLLAAARHAGLDVHDGGCIAVSQGPRLETAAEIARFRQDGCDLVGMTTMPEAALAREAELDYASLCVSANWAAGLAEPVSMQAIESTLAESMLEVRELLRVFFKVCTDVC